MKRLFFSFTFLAVSLMSVSAHAAVGCQLNDPDRDVKKIFPKSTGYKSDFVSIKDVGGEKLYQEIEKTLGDTLDQVYEASDVPYSFYKILKGKTVIGYIHGVNQRGTFGGMQLIVSTDPYGRIINFYYQKMSSPEAARFMDSTFTNRFNGLVLSDFLKGDLKISDPSKESNDDFKATLRGIKKNLILLKELELRVQIK